MSEWPKPWGEIYEEPERGDQLLFVDTYTMVGDDQMRLYDGEIYVPIGDEWAPFYEYVDMQIEKALDARPAYQLGDRQL